MIEVAAFVDWFLFGWAGLSVAYLIFFAFLALRRSSVAYPRSGRKSRILVLFPAYKADRVIEGSIRSLLDQDYPKEMYHTVVISDQMEPVTLQRLAGYPVEVLPIVNNARTKARALQLAVERLEPDSFDTVVVLDADNTVLPISSPGSTMPGSQVFRPCKGNVSPRIGIPPLQYLMRPAKR